MCGIAGIAGKNARSLEHVVQNMNDCLAHRGPDEHAIASFDNCVLGHRRLSIVDLTTGQQPMHSPFGTSLIFNGEFYGFREIRDKLNYPYKTTSDTEVVLALYQEYKDSLAKHMRGMFSLALWDENRQVLYAARDRFGEKPFYYALAGDKFVFASEIKSILTSKLVKPEIDPEALTHFLKHLYVHPHHTIYKNIFTLPPAHELIFEKGSVDVRPYWKLPAPIETISKEDAISECRRLLTKAVSDQLVADVPVGCFLSGGIDSSTITALAAKNLSGQLTTISFSFGKRNSELTFSRPVAEKYKTKNIELHQDDYDMAKWFEKMASIYDEPFADSSNIPTYLISQMASERMKVVLTGDGGDELMAGYTSWYRPLYRMKHPEGFGDSLRNQLKKWRHAKYAGSTIAEMHKKQNEYFDDNELRSICKYKTGYSFDKFTNQPVNGLDAAMRMDILDYMPGDILVKTDRAAMANSLELRAPFLDVDFAEFCISLPESFKINAHADKLLMRDAFGDLWPENIRNRPKQGFGAPVQEWLEQPGMASLKNDHLFNRNHIMYNWLDYDACSTYFTRNNYQTWILLTFAVWMDRHR